MRAYVAAALGCALAVAAPLLPSASRPAAAQGTGMPHLAMAVGAPVTSLDPHFHNLSPNNAVADILYDSLVATDARARLRPGLAESWAASEDGRTWTFRLRPGARFHDGSTAFAAEDVAFTFSRVPNVPNSPSSFAAFVRPVREVEVVDPLTVRLRTAEPYPLLPTDLVSVRMLSGAIHARAATEEFNAGRAAVGTGPYRLVEFRPGERIVFERHDAYWGGPQPWARVTYRIVPNDAARTAALLAGDVDVIDQVPTADLARLRAEARLRISETDGLRVIYLALDRRSAESTPTASDAEGRPLGRNPLDDLRVRRALSLAVDRPGIAARVMEGAAVPTGQFLPEGAFGHDPDLPAPRHDPEAARRLLAEAGFPDGFRLTLHSPNDRYVNDARIAQAVGGMWTRVGVRTAVEAQPWTTFVSRAGRGEFSAFLVGWGSTSGEASSPLRALVATHDPARGWGASNRGRYSNPAVDGPLAEALRTVEDAAREALLRQATRAAMEDVAVVPIHLQRNLWAMRRGLAHEARADELTRPQDVRPATP